MYIKNNKFINILVILLGAAGKMKKDHLTQTICSRNKSIMKDTFKRPQKIADRAKLVLNEENRPNHININESKMM